MVTSFIRNIMERWRGNQEKKMVAEIFSDSRAVFSSFGRNIYASDFINNCIDRIAVEISKINVVSVVETEGKLARQNDDISRLFSCKPNPLQTTKDFLACLEWLRRKNMNAFVYPQYDTVKSKTTGKEFRRYKAFYPLNPTHAELGHFEDGRWAIKFFWRDGTWDILPYDNVIHLRWRRGTSTLMGGGDDYGMVDEQSTMRSLVVLDKMLQGVPKMIESGLSLSGVLQAKTMTDKKGLEKIRDDFEEKIIQSKAGIAILDLAGEFHPINKTMPDIPENVMKFVKDVIRERYGISDAIMSGDYSGDQHSAFYQSCIEDFIVEFEQAFSEALFTQRERDVGHRVKGYYSKVAYFSTKDKLEMAKLATATGIATLNQVAEMFGYPPFEGGDRRLQSLNYADTNIVDQYQISTARRRRKENPNDETE